MIIDTHCHLDDDRYKDDLDEVINRAVESSVGMFIIPAGDPDTLGRAIEISESYASVYFAVGTHPYDAIKYNRDFLEEFVSHPKCVAVGECGLDYYRLPDNEDEIKKEKKIQKDIFIDQIKLANKYNKPLIIHIRDASRDSLEILESYAGKQGGVLHCYNADHELLKLEKHNFYFGIGGVLTFANARKLIEVYARIPLDKLLIETDAPYLTPHPHRGKRNEPSYCTFIAQKMSELSGISSDEIADITTQNAKRLFGI